MKKTSKTNPGSVNIEGNGNIVGNHNINMNIGSNLAEWTQVFETIYGAARQVRDPVVRKDAESLIKEIEEEVQKGEDANPSRVERWLGFLADTAPDVWDVAVDTLSNPIKGISTVIRKVIAKAKSKAS